MLTSPSGPDVSEANSPDPAAGHRDGHRSRRWAVRYGVFFLFSFSLLYGLPLIALAFDRMPGFRLLASTSDRFWGVLVPWVATHVLGVDFDMKALRYTNEWPFEYVQTGSTVCLAALVALGWALMERGRTNIQRLKQWLRAYLRLALAGILFWYGWNKVIPVQFPALGPDRLSLAIGEATPHVLMWTFMGFSAPYVVFAGLGEVLAGVLLCFRRTTTLGALIGVAVMSNVVMLNFAYDVGVKLNASFYLLGLAYLVIPDLSRLRDMLVFNRPTLPTDPSPLARNESHDAWIRRFAGVLAACFFVAAAYNGWTGAREWGRLAPQPALYGLYDVDSVSRNGRMHSLAPVDSTLWARVAIGQIGSTTVRLASGQVGTYRAAVDTAARTVRFAPRAMPDDTGRPGVATNALQTHTLAYEQPDSTRLVFHGRIAGDTMTLFLTRRDVMQYRLVSHRWPWAQERPGPR